MSLIFISSVLGFFFFIPQWIPLAGYSIGIFIPKVPTPYFEDPCPRGIKKTQNLKKTRY